MSVFDISEFQPDDRVKSLKNQGADGIIVKIGDNRIDGSVTGRLQSLKAELIAKTH